jgi:hypothetical protein
MPPITDGRGEVNLDESTDGGSVILPLGVAGFSEKMDL